MEATVQRNKQTLPGRLSRYLCAFAVVGALGAAEAAAAQQIGEALAARLSSDQQRAYVLYTRARAVFDRDLQAYWSAVDDKREQRKRKRAAGQPFTRDDYVAEHPPKYAGPSLSPEIARIIAELRPPEPETPKPVVADFLAAARTEFSFLPTPTTDREFKRRYSEEALAAGLTRDQVVRVYALETGGRGTYDMQAGIDPETRKGRPISSALGYAQLLGANSVNEVVKHGDYFVSRLAALAAAPGTPPKRAAVLRSKMLVLRRMQKAARTVPNEWAAHVRFASTPKGLAIHALNLDADIGPLLQVVKLKGLREEAERAGRTRLTGAEIELMNLAGPRTGLEMMEPVARAMPTANFFSQGAYGRNTIVREKTAAELLAALDERMEVNLKKTGSIEFAQAFDTAAGGARRIGAR
jgi:hypothetical protein